MKEQRRIILLLIVFLLQGCSSTENMTKDKTKLHVAVFDGAYDQSYWDEVARRFEYTHPDVDIQLDINENIGNILLPRIAGNTLPDVIYLGTSNASGFTTEMIKGEYIASLSDVFTPTLEHQFMENVLDSFVIRPYEDEDVYLAPLYFNVTGLWYNNALFERYGYEVPTTWDEFFALGDRAKLDGFDLLLYQGMNPTYLEAMLWPMLAEKMTLENLNNIYQNRENAWSQEGVVDVLSTFEKLRPYMDATTISLTYMQAQQRFMEDEALFIPCGNWLETEMQDIINEDDDLVFMSVPSYSKDAKKYATVMLEQIYVPKNAKQAALGKEFVAYQFTPENVEMNQRMSGGVVPIKQDEQPYHEQPYQIFNTGVTPISANFSPLLNVDMNKEVFEQLTCIIAGTKSVQDVITYLNAFTHE